MVQKKVKNFAFIIYNDSAPTDWTERLTKLHLPGYYIYHDKDVKKPHYHVLITYANAHSLDSVKEIVSYVGGANGVYEDVKSLHGYARYLCHLDNPEKHRYDTSEVISMGGTDYTAYVQTENDKLTIMREIIRYCREHDIRSYSNLVDYCEEEKPEWFKLLYSYRGILVRDYIKSREWTKRYFL